MELKDGNTVSSRSYYYLLDFNDRDDFKELSKFGVTRLLGLDLQQYKALFAIAVFREFISI